MAKSVRTFVFNFQRQFADAVTAGRKLQTVRATRADNKVPRPGETVKLYTGLRTRLARLLNQGTVTECLPVRMDLGEPPSLTVGAEVLRGRDLRLFAESDGFESAAAMFEWFRGTHGFEFEGFCVKWQPKSRGESR